MANFETALEKTLKWEGGYVDDPSDSGGETIYGISRNNHPKLTMWQEIDNYKAGLAPFDKTKYSQLEALCDGNSAIQNDVKNAYKNYYWSKVKGDDIEKQENANVLFDWAVNSGVSRVVKFAQRMVGETEDGVCGEKTIKGINGFENFCNAFTQFRIDWYNSRGEQYDKYKKGWVKRAESFKV